MFALAFQRCVSLEPKQELDRRRSARKPGCPNAVRHLITGQCPLTRDTWRIIRTAEEVCPFLSPYGSALAARPRHMARTGHRTPRPSRPEPCTGGCIRGCDYPPSPAQLGLPGKKVWSLVLQTLQSQHRSSAVFLLWGPHERPLSETLLTLPSSPNLLLCMLVPSLLPACQEPQKTCSGGGVGGGGPSGPATSSSSAAPGRRELKSARKRQRGGARLRGGGGTGLKLLFLANGDLFFLLPGGWTWPSWLQGLLQFEVAPF